MSRHSTQLWIVLIAFTVCLGVTIAARPYQAKAQTRATDEASGDDAAQESPENELRGLLQQKRDLLHQSIKVLKRHAEMGLQTSSFSDAASLMKECVVGELELCHEREERRHVCTRNLKEMDNLLTKAKALLSAGMLPRSELMKLSVHQLDARILLVREQMKPTTTEIGPPEN